VKQRREEKDLWRRR